MNDNNKLIVQYDMQPFQAGIVMLSGLTIFMCLLLWASSYLYILIGAYFTRVITLCLWGIVAYLAFTLFYTLWFINFNNRPAAILSSEGIWVNHFGFIEWDNVQSCQMYKHPGIPLESVTILVHDLKKLSKQANIAGKMAIFGSRLFCVPYIFLTNVTVNNETIVAYVQAHLKEIE